MGIVCWIEEHVYSKSIWTILVLVDHAIPSRYCLLDRSAPWQPALVAALGNHSVEEVSNTPTQRPKWAGHTHLQLVAVDRYRSDNAEGL